MKSTLASLLLCPVCFGELELAADSTNGGWGTPNDDIGVGLLTCRCGMVCEIAEGVPRLLDRERTRPPDSIKAEAVQGNGRSSRVHPRKTYEQDPYAYIRESFSKEWRLFNYDSDKTWGWTLEERKKIFLDDLALSEQDLKGKVVLDAGCGNGTLTAAVASFNVQVVGIDLNDGLGSAARNKARFADGYSENVQYVQGNLAEPPLKPASFDILYCSGVLHHTPSTRESFRRLVPLVKTGGRVYIWVYGRRNVIVRAYMDLGRGMRRILSPQGLLRICKIMAPLYKAGTQLLNLARVMEFRKRSSREITLDLFDAFAPQFNHRHTEDEVRNWFEQCGFMNITVSGRQKHGFGVFGDKL